MRIKRNRSQRSPVVNLPTSYQATIENANALNSGERYAGNNGEINAGSRKELLSRIVEIADRIESGDFETEVAADNQVNAQQRKDQLVAAYHDQTGARWAETGALLAAEVNQRVTRLGFSRRLLTRGEVQQGSNARIRVPENNVQAVVATGPTQVGYEVIRGKYIYPTEFYVIANPRVEQGEISRGSGDILGDILIDSNQAILVAEDRTFLSMLDAAVPIYNGITYFTGQLTPAVIAQLQENINTWGYNTTNMIMSMDLLKDISTGTAFNNDWLEPVSRLEIILTGRIGTLLGLDIATDGYRHPKLQVLGNGEILVTTMPESLGAYTDRYGIQSEPRINDKDFPGRGWFMYEEISQAIGNAMGVAKAQRI